MLGNGLHLTINNAWQWTTFDYLQRLKDLDKQKEQLGEEGLAVFDYAFAENGLNAFLNGNLLATEVGFAYCKRPRFNRSCCLYTQYNRAS